MIERDVEIFNIWIILFLTVIPVMIISFAFGIGEYTAWYMTSIIILWFIKFLYLIKYRPEKLMEWGVVLYPLYLDLEKEVEK